MKFTNKYMKIKRILHIANISLITCLLVTIISCKREKTVKEETEEVKSKVLEWNRLNNSFSEQGLDSLLSDKFYHNGYPWSKSTYLKEIKFDNSLDPTTYDIFDTISVEQDGTPHGVVFKCNLIRRSKHGTYTYFEPIILAFGKNENGVWKLESESCIGAEKQNAKEREQLYIQNNIINEHNKLIDISIDGYVYLYRPTREFSNKEYNSLCELGRGGTLNRYIPWNNGIGSLVEKTPDYPFEGLGNIVNAIFSVDNKVFIECEAWKESNAIFYCGYDGRIYYISKGSLIRALSKDLILIETYDIVNDKRIYKFQKIIDYKGNIIFSEILN